METLKVFPNPWSALDKDGHPCGVCPRDPVNDAGGPASFVGARIDNKRTQVLQDFGEMAPHELRSPMQKTKYSYLGIPSDDPNLGSLLAQKEPIEIPRTKYYRDRLLEGSLIAADAVSALSANSRFVAPAEFFASFAPPPVAPVAPSAPEPSTAPEAPQSRKRDSKSESEVAS